MLSELWGFIKLTFMKRMYLNVTQVLSLTLFMLLPVLGLVAFLIATALLVPSFASSINSQFKLLFVKKHEADESLRKDVDQIACQLGVKVKKTLVAKGLCNAYVRFGTVVLGEELLNRCGPGPRKAIIAHELVHMKEQHMLFKTGAVVVLGILLSSVWLRLSWPIIINMIATQVLVNIMIEFALLAYLTVFMILPNWYMEIRADQGAVRIAGKACLIMALLAIVTKDQFKLHSEDHPAVSERIKLILQYDSENSLTRRMSVGLKRLVKR